MPLAIGTQLGSHEITALLGKGGMGEVYRARDLKLKREVAIKILPDEFSRDADRVGRFQREAEALAALNHPNIAAIYDLEEVNGSRYLVLELVEGETLADRIARGPIPVTEALEIAKHICEALEAAHEKGIIHRDLKPANVKITHDGKVKVLDFGLAKGLQNPQEPSLSNSPTLMSASTPGAILGTAAYMSPEQAKAKETDRTTDVWAFGCVLYEMLTGHAAFGGETIGEILANVFKSDPDWDSLPAATPESLRRLLRRCLAKDRRLRLHDLADARIEIEDTRESHQEIRIAPFRRPWLRIVAGIAVGAALIVTSYISIRHFRESVTTAQAIGFEVAIPRKAAFGRTAGNPGIELSPDGHHLAFVATKDGNSADRVVWLHTFDSIQSRPLPGTEGILNGPSLFWSPDSKYVGFVRAGQLQKTPILGGAVQSICEVGTGMGGATWGRRRNDYLRSPD